VIIFLLSILARSGSKISEYELFYEDTISDVSETIRMLEGLMKRDFVANDPDVQNVHRVIVIIHDILSGYINARRERREETK
jgi:hypothetical protein